MGPQREPLKRKPNVKGLILILRKDQSLWKSYEKAYWREKTVVGWERWLKIELIGGIAI